RDQYCDVLYDLYVPNSASPSSPVPAILTTNGFGGSKDDQASEADLFARNGYLVLSYSGLGFGGSSCAIEIDSPEWDGRAASHMVDLIAARDDVIEDGPNDPRVGTWGGSYGGGFQFALASVDSRVDAMIPLITWNDLSYSLGPNNDARNFIYTNSPPGASKYEWSELFFADGNAQPALNPGTSGWTSGQPPDAACPGFDPEVCVINTESLAAGYLTADTIAFLRHASAQYEFFSNPNVTRSPAMAAWFPRGARSRPARRRSSTRRTESRRATRKPPRCSRTSPSARSRRPILRGRLRPSSRPRWRRTSIRWVSQPLISA